MTAGQGTECVLLRAKIRRKNRQLKPRKDPHDRRGSERIAVIYKNSSRWSATIPSLFKQAIENIGGFRL